MGKWKVRSWGGGEDLGAEEGGKTMARIYCSTKITLFIKKTSLLL